MANPYQRFLDAGQISFPNGTTWAIIKRLASPQLQNVEYPYEMSVVYSCTKVPQAEEGTATHMEAVIKVKMQIDIIDYDCEKGYGRSLGPSEIFHDNTANELGALELLATASCQSAPRLLDVKKEYQREDDEFPGGYVVFILMTHLPGTPPWDFCELPRGEKARIQKAFKEAIGEVYRCGIMPKDGAIRNILWDEESGRCSIVGFKDVCFRSTATEDDLWCVDDGLLPSWDLAEYSGYLDVIDLYGDGSCMYRPIVRQHRSKGTKDSAQGYSSIPCEPPHVGATTASGTDHQTKRKKSRRISIRKLLAWCTPRRGGRLLRNLWYASGQT